LGFGLRLDKFAVSFYPDGMPSEYRSDVTFLDQDKEVMKAVLKVNDPADYRGVDFYQSSYGQDHLLQVDVTRGDKTDKAVLKTGAWSPLPGGGQAGVLEYRENVDMGGRYKGPLARVLYQAGENDEPQVIPALKPGAKLMEGGPVRMEITGVESVSYSGFSVKYDPGVWFIWVGCTLMVLGFIVTFYTSHQKAWIRLIPEKNRTRWEIAGSTNKNRLGLRRKLTRLANEAQPQPKQGE
jgi:cytochrome c biogenesis protein